MTPDREALRRAAERSINADWWQSEYEVEFRLQATEDVVLALLADRDALQARVSSLEKAINGFADDYMTSETHHPGWVLIPQARFEAIATLQPEERQ